MHEADSQIEGAVLDAASLPSPLSLTSLLERAALTDHGILEVTRAGTSERLGYATLHQRALAVAAQLSAAGLRPGDASVLQFDCSLDFLSSFWGCVYAGVVAVPLAPVRSPSSRSKLQVVWQMLGKPLISSSGALARSLSDRASGFEESSIRDLETAVRGACPNARAPTSAGSAGDVALLLPTSGSTGAPKLVMQTHEQLVRRSIAATRTDAERPRTSLNWMPLDHVGGLVMFHLYDVCAGNPQIQVATEHVASAPLRWLDLIHQHRVARSWAPNFAFRALVDALEGTPERRWDLTCLEELVNAGEMIVRATLRRLCELLASSGFSPAVLRPVWGMSETCSGVTEARDFNPFAEGSEAERVGVGEPLPGVRLRIVDEAGCVLPEGQEGRLQVAGTGLTLGYWQDEPRTRAAFTRDGWLKTGDLGSIQRGKLTVTGREDEVIIVNGVNIHPREIEHAVERACSTALLQVVACKARCPGDDSDSVVVFIVPRSAEPQLDLVQRARAAVRDELGVLARVIRVDADQLPRTHTGKLQRRLLAQRIAGSALPVAPEPLEHGSIRVQPSDLRARGWQLARSSGRSPQRLSQVLVAADATLAENVARHCTRRGIIARPASTVAAAFSLLAREPGVVVYIPGSGGLLPGAEDHIDAQLTCIIRDLMELRAVALRSCDGPRELIVLTSGAQSAVPSDKASWPTASAAGIWGAARVLQNEDAGLTLRLIDVEAGADSKRLSDVLCSEARFAPELAADEVAWRGTERYVPCLSACSPADRVQPFSVAGKTVLITGGFGGLGRAMARHLARRQIGRLVLAGRRVDRAEVRWLEQHGVLTEAHAVDVTDAAQVRALIQKVTFDGPPLSVILHAAGGYGDTSAARLTEPGARDALAARVAGAWNLHRATRECGYERFVLFSSIAGVLGYPSMAAYSAASELLDALARAMRNDGLPAISVNWPAWSDVGRSVGDTVRHHHRLGVGTIDAETALQILDELLEANRASNTLLRLDLERWYRFCPGSRHKALLAAAASAPAIDARQPALQSSLSIGSEVELGPWLRQSLATVLGVASDDIGVACRFDELGLSSLGTLEFRELIESRLALTLTAGFAWRYPTLGDLTDHLEQRRRRKPAASVTTIP